MDRAVIDRLNRDAPCAGADPVLFDQTEPRLAIYALAYCARCPVTSLCRTVVRPGRSWYDGIAAAAVYRNGRVVASLTRDRRTRELVSTLLPDRSHP